MAEERINRKLAAILAADVVGYSRLMGADEAGTLAALKRHREAIFDPAVAAHNGRIVKLIGDGAIRSERQLMEQLDYNLLYRWFVGLSPDDQIWDPTTFTKNRNRLQTGAVFAKFMSKLLTIRRLSRCCQTSIFRWTER